MRNKNKVEKAKIQM